MRVDLLCRQFVYERKNGIPKIPVEDFFRFSNKPSVWINAVLLRNMAAQLLLEATVKHSISKRERCTGETNEDSSGICVYRLVEVKQGSGERAVTCTENILLFCLSS